MNERGPANDRPRNRAWVLVALLTLAAFTVNPPLTIRVQIGSPDSARSVPPVAEPRPPVVRVHVTAAFRPETHVPTSSDNPPADVVELPAPTAPISAPVPNFASEPEAVDPLTPFVLDESNGTPAPEVYLPPPPASLDPEIVRAAFVPEPNAAQRKSNPIPESAGPTQAADSDDARAFSDSFVDQSQTLSTLEQAADPLFPAPVFDEYAPFDASPGGLAIRGTCSPARVEHEPNSGRNSNWCSAELARRRSVGNASPAASRKPRGGLSQQQLRGRQVAGG